MRPPAAQNVLEPRTRAARRIRSSPCSQGGSRKRQPSHAGSKDRSEQSLTPAEKSCLKLILMKNVLFSFWAIPENCFIQNGKIKVGSLWKQEELQWWKYISTLEVPWFTKSFLLNFNCWLTLVEKSTKKKVSMNIYTFAQWSLMNYLELFLCSQRWQVRDLSGSIQTTGSGNQLPR